MSIQRVLLVGVLFAPFVFPQTILIAQTNSVPDSFLETQSSLNAAPITETLDVKPQVNNDTEVLNFDIATQEVEAVAKEVKNLEAEQNSENFETTSSGNPYPISPGSKAPDITYRQDIKTNVNTFSGALIQVMPISIPAGRNELDPDLSLEYSSQNQENGSHVGYGWTLSIPYIERLNKTGVEKLYADNFFISSIDGELSAVGSSSQYRAKFEDGAFLEYKFINNVWIVTDKKGLLYTFGATTSERQYAPGNVASTTKWMLSEVRDTNNNFYRYEYVKHDNEIYPSKIIYTGHGDVDGIYVVDFILENRPDTYTSYKYGYRIDITRRIKDIIIKVNNVERSRYALRYTPGFNGTRSLLGSVTESKTSLLSETTVLPPTVFEYTRDPIAYIKRDENANNATRDGYFQSGRTVLDIDGNGLNERLVSTQITQGTWESLGLLGGSLNKGFNMVMGINVVVPRPWAFIDNQIGDYEFLDYGTRVIDVNGDGLSDFVSSMQPLQDGPYNRNLFINQGNGNFATTTLSEAPTFRYYEYIGLGPNFAYVAPALFANVNGDQIVDTYSPSTQCQSALIPGPPQHLCGLPGAYIGTGDGWKLNSRNLPPDQLVHAGRISQIIFFGDVNGDGLDDLIQKGHGSTTVAYLNLGNNTWSNATSTWLIPHAPQTDMMGRFDLGVRVLDINGDGLVDILRSYNVQSWDVGWWNLSGVNDIPFAETVKVAYINTGYSWVLSTDIPVFGVIDGMHIVNFNWRGRMLVNDSYFDANGDGLVDFGNNIRQGRKPDMLTKVILSTGGEIDVEYKPTPQHMKPRGTTGYFDQVHPNLPSVMYTVTKITKTPGMGGIPQIEEYIYENGKNDFRGPNTLKFAGFRTVTKITGASKTVSYFHQGNDSDLEVGEQGDEYAKIGKVFREDVTDLSNNVYKRTWYNWLATPLGSNAWFTRSGDIVEQLFSGAQHVDKAVSYVHSTTTGLLIEQIEWGEVIGSQSTQFADVGQDKKRTVFSYAINPTISALSEKVVYNHQNVPVFKERLYFDDLPFGSISKGNNTKIQNYTGLTTYAESRKIYNDKGSVREAIDPEGNKTQYIYDEYALYPKTITNPLGHILTYTYDYLSGKPTVITDPNHTIKLSYDGFGRPLSEKIVYTNGTEKKKIEYQYQDTLLAVSIKSLKYITHTETQDEYIYFDGFNRPIQKKKEFENGMWSTVDTVYSNSGNIEYTSLPYFSPISTRTAPTTSQPLRKYYTYDPLGRHTEERTILGSTKTRYDKWTRIVTDPLLRHTNYRYDAFDNLVEVVQSLGLIDYKTTYSYDTNKKLIKITDPESNIRNFEYDWLGRQTRAEDLHAQNDSTFVVYQYVYDDNGNILTKILPDGRSVTYTYDALNRITYEKLSGTMQVEVINVYDTCTYGVGRLCSASTPEYYKLFTYTQDGFVDTETVMHDGTAVTTYTYTPMGNILSIKNPDNSKILHTYDTAGYAESIYYVLPTGATSSIVTQLEYAPTGLPTIQVNGNGTKTCVVYDQNNLYRLASKKTVSAGSICAGGLQVVPDQVLLQKNNYHEESIEQKIQRLLKDGLVTLSNTGETRLLHPEVIFENEYEKELLVGFTQDKQPLYRYEVVIGKGIPGTEKTLMETKEDMSNSLSIATSSINLAPQATVLATNSNSGNIVPYPDPWNVVRNMATGTHMQPIGGSGYVTSEFGRNRTQAVINRTFMTFDTRNIPDNAILQSAYLDLYASPYSNIVSPADYIGVLQSFQMATSSISLNDYSRCGSPQSLPLVGAKKPLSEFTGQQLYRLPLFAEAQPWINVQGMTQLCLREGRDIENYSPVGAGWEFDRRGITVFPETSVLAQRSKIIVEYMLPVATTTASSFPTTSLTNLSQPATSSSIQTHNYTYDAVGNILTITTNLASSSPQVTTYTYDNLNRLLSATSPTFSEYFTYDSMGNILTRNGVPYLYQSPNKTNPHAVTKIGDIGLTYDTAGNVLTIGEQVNPTTNIWNYKNELVQTSRGGITVDYLYDTNGTRISKIVDGIITKYPSPYFSHTNTGTTTTFVMLNNENLATIEGAKILWNHTDHLGSTIATINQSGGIVETTEYTAFGHQKSRSTHQNTQQAEKYTNHTYDPETDLLYAQARYYRGSMGRFLSQDPVFWSPQKFLDNPQSMNSYSYGNNNPIVNKDPLGLFAISTGKVEKGDTLSKITNILNVANGTNYSISQVAKLNGIKDIDKISVGQILIPNSSIPDITNDLSQKMWTNVRDTGIQNPFYFKSKVEKSGDWDLKSQVGIYCSSKSCGGQEYSNYVFLGEKIPYDAPGNIHYGYVGSNTWFGNSSFLHYMADQAQNLDNKTNVGDTVSDRNYIDYGIRLFKSNY